jgi:hypothetical protein
VTCSGTESTVEGFGAAQFAEEPDLFGSHCCAPLEEPFLPNDLQKARAPAEELLLWRSRSRSRCQGAGAHPNEP